MRFYRNHFQWICSTVQQWRCCQRFTQVTLFHTKISFFSLLSFVQFIFFIFSLQCLSFFIERRRFLKITNCKCNLSTLICSLMVSYFMVSYLSYDTQSFWTNISPKVIQLDKFWIYIIYFSSIYGRF